MVLPIMANTGKGYLFQTSYTSKLGISLLAVYERVENYFIQVFERVYNKNVTIRHAITISF